jgi:hypothetical protein
VTRDARGWRIALVPDCIVNPPPGQVPRVLGILEENGYGVLQLPPPGSHSPLLAVIADQVAEYSHHGYAVLALGVAGEPGHGLHWRRLSPLLRHRGVDSLPRHVFHPDRDPHAEGRRLAERLASYDLDEDQQRHWRA